MKYLLIAVTAFLSLAILPTLSYSQDNDFSAVLIDAISKQSVPSARILLAPVNIEKTGCALDTSLTGISNEKGEVSITNVPPGEYVFFYNISGVLCAELDGKVVNYHRSDNDSYVITISRTLGPLTVLSGSQLGIVDGALAILNGYMHAADFDLSMICTAGTLHRITIPLSERPPPPIEIRIDNMI